MSASEILTITVLCHLSGFRTFEHFYVFYLQKHLNREFPNTVSYNRFVELMRSNVLPLAVTGFPMQDENERAVNYVRQKVDSILDRKNHLSTLKSKEAKKEISQISSLSMATLRNKYILARIYRGEKLEQALDKILAVE